MVTYDDSDLREAVKGLFILHTWLEFIDNADMAHWKEKNILGLFVFCVQSKFTYIS